MLALVKKQKILLAYSYDGVKGFYGIAALIGFLTEVEADYALDAIEIL